MPRNSELSGFQKGEIVGYHRKGRSLKDISKELNIPKSTMAFVIKKWKLNVDCRNMLLTGRPKKLTDKDRRVLAKEIRKNRTKPMAHILQELQKATMTVVSINIIFKDAHLLGFHDRAAAHKLLITKSNRAARLR